MNSFQAGWVTASAVRGCVLACLAWMFASPILTDAGWAVVPQAQVTGEGIFLDQVVTSSDPAAAVPHIKVAESPSFGRSMVLPATQVRTQAAALSPASMAGIAWSGSAAVMVTRKSRPLPASEILQALIRAVESEGVADLGELELRFTRTWNPVPIPDEPYSVRLSEMPPSGLLPHFSLRFELLTSNETVGTWQVPVEAKVWKQAWVSQDTFKRGDPILGSQAVLERRDVLKTRDGVSMDLDWSRGWQAAEPISPGQPILRRALQLRPVVHRGQVVDALLKDGSITIGLKVEALEGGTPGQVIRLRNPLSRREIRGKVLNDQVVHIQL